MNLNTKFLFLCFFLLFFISFWVTPTHAKEEFRWQTVLDRVSGSVLSIRVDGVRNFDTAVSSSRQATGFIIDAERGIVLTNRHVVQPGPVVAKGIFLNREEIHLTPIYRDPVHDFGLFKYNPALLRYNTPMALTLKPEGVQIGREIRVIGNDGGEQLSILAGTISRLDRSAPNYGSGKYNDFNTFYIQAASSTSGGSSGAPVVDINGNAIALNASAHSRTASSFFLPLDRVVNAYELLVKGETIHRGTLQTTFKQSHYDELARLGLSNITEQHARQHDIEATGLLMVHLIVPGGPADGILQVGDVLLKIDDQWIRHFVTLEALLDSRVNQTVRITVERGGVQREVSLVVQDLHTITPASFIEAGGSILHNLSYQQARSFNVPITGVYVAKSGYMLGNESIHRGDVITSLAGQPINNLSDATSVLSNLANGARFSLRFFSPTNPRQTKHRVVTMDRRWFEAKTCIRDDEQGLWPCSKWTTAPEALPLKPQTTGFAVTENNIIEKLAPSLVVVDFNVSYPVEGLTNNRYVGAGLIVDAERGWVLVDRNTVPTTIGDVYITFAGSIEIPAQVEFIHPYHNFSIVSFDPALIGSTKIKSAQFSSHKVMPGDNIWLVGPKGGNHRLTSHKTTVADVDALVLPLPRTPAFREYNLEAITLTSKVSTVGGVLANKAGDIVALWAGLEVQSRRGMSQTVMGIPVEVVQEVLKSLDGNFDADLRTLPAELLLMSIAEARKRGLPEKWALEIEQHNPTRRNVLYVERMVAGTQAAETLQEGDLILAINGKTVNTFRQVEKASRSSFIDVTLLRKGQVQHVKLNIEILNGSGLTRILNWAGAVLHRPHRAIAAQRGFSDPGLFVAWTWAGSPASHYGINRSLRIIGLNGHDVTDIDSFLNILAKLPKKVALRLKVLNLAGKATMLTLQPDEHYWPTVELIKTSKGWQRH